MLRGACRKHITFLFLSSTCLCRFQAGQVEVFMVLEDQLGWYGLFFLDLFMRRCWTKIQPILFVCLALLAGLSCSRDLSDRELHDLFDTKELESELEKKASAPEFILSLKQWHRLQPPTDYYLHRLTRSPQVKAQAVSQTGWKVRDNPTLDVMHQVDWGSNPKGDSNWLFQINAFYPAAAFIQSHSETDNTDWLSVPTHLMLDWIEYNIELRRPNEMKWDDMSTGLRAVTLAYLIDAHLRNDLLDAEALERLIRVAVLHAEELADPGKLAAGNHAYFQLVGLAAICKTLPLLRRCASDFEYIDRVFEQVIAGQFNLEGLHREHAPDYHFFSLARLDAILKTGWFRLSPQFQRRVEQARANLSYLVHPDNSRIMFGDTERRPGKALGGAPCIQLSGKVFYESGYALLKGGSACEGTTRPWSLAFWAGDERPKNQISHSYGHSHADNFTFEWFDQGRLIITDAGKYAYDSDKWREYIKSTRAHNTVEIDGRDFRNRTENYVQPGILDADDKIPLPYVHAFVKHDKFDVEQRRVIVSKPNRWLVVIDLLEGSGEHTYTQWFHFHEDWQVQKQGYFFAATADEETLLVQNLSPSGVVSHSARGAEAPRLQGWVSPAYKVILPNAALGFSNRGRTSNIATLFRHGPFENTVDVEKLVLDGPRIEVCWQVNGSVEGFSMVLGKAPTQCE